MSAMSIKVNPNFRNIAPNYLFSDVAARVAAYTEAHPEARILRLGVGDVTLPLTGRVIAAMAGAVSEMADGATFRGYAPESGYDFLREAVARHYERFGVSLAAREVFISDGAKNDCGNLTELFGDNPVFIPDPVYPVYLDSNLMAGRKVTFLPATRENDFLPTPEGLGAEAAIIYICSPNNPTGAVYDRERLGAWVEHALRTGSLIIYDAAYEAFIEGDVPHSIFEIEGARACAIEVASLSKTAGFTGTRCSWTVIPEELQAEGFSLRDMWERRQATKFNGVPYVVQRGAEAALSPEGYAECLELVGYYRENAELIVGALRERDVFFTGGASSPYLWMRCPRGMGSWEFFDWLLATAQVVGTPGAGFGAEGEGYFRLTSFGSRESTAEAVERLRACL